MLDRHVRPKLHQKVNCFFVYDGEVHYGKFSWNDGVFLNREDDRHKITRLEWEDCLCWFDVKSDVSLELILLLENTINKAKDQFYDLIINDGASDDNSGLGLLLRDCK